MALATVFLVCCGKEDPAGNTDRQQGNEQTTEQGTGQEQQQEEPELDSFTGSIILPQDHVFYNDKPSFSLRLTNPNKVAATSEITVVFKTDKGKKTDFDFQAGTYELAAGQTKKIKIESPKSITPGFYTVSVQSNGAVIRGTSKKIGIDPFNIDSKADKQDDFDTFWADAYTQLKAVEMNPEFVKTLYDGTWMVSLNSIPDGLEGEPMVIRCYYVEPTKDGKAHPVIVHYYGYDDWEPGVLVCPYGRGEYAHLYVSTRGQKINCRTASLRIDGIQQDFVNPYDKQWFTVNFGDKNSYYYRGAYMDCVQGIRFLALCDDERVKGKVDIDKLFVEGLSQGGAFSYAAAALSTDYPVKAVSAAVAFMGDFPDYFTIVPNDGGGFPWMARNCKKELGWSDDQMYEFLSYFDTKNLATKVSCPIIACSGLEDNICPPHTNIAPFNNALTPSEQKDYTFYPDMGHAHPSGWDAKYQAFFKSQLE